MNLNFKQIGSCACVSILASLASISSFSQSVFAIQVENISRGYLLTQSRGSSSNQPLIIVLHESQSSALATFQQESLWKKLKKPVVIVFPMATNNHWDCYEKKELNKDIQFVKKVIEEVQRNFQIDHDRVFIIGDGDGYCLAQLFKNLYPRLVSSIFYCEPRNISTNYHFVTDQ